MAESGIAKDFEAGESSGFFEKRLTQPGYAKSAY
jgi:hypothetical protein